MAAPAKGATRTVACEGCGLSGHPNTMYQMVTGWQRRGSSSVTAKRYEQRWACKPCVEAFGKTGQTWEQLSLLTPEQDQALHDDLAEMARTRRRGEAAAMNVVLP